MKSNIDHNSEIEFSIGVPVKANLISPSKFFNDVAFWVVKFLIYCASSAIMYLNCLSSYSNMSLFSESYDAISSFLVSASPFIANTFILSPTHFSISAFQFNTNELGHTTIDGFTFFDFISEDINAITCKVFPKPHIIS